MEEQNKAKEVKMGTEGKEPQKLSYEDLHKACVQLSQENQYLKQQLQNADKYIQTFNRLDYLFKVVEIEAGCRDSRIFHEEFYFKCIREIEDVMTIPEKEETAKDN